MATYAHAHAYAYAYAYAYAFANMRPLNSCVLLTLTELYASSFMCPF